MTRSLTICMTLLGAAAWGQAPSPTFEVASVRVSTSLQQAVAEGATVGMRITPGHVSIGHTALAKLIRIAYGITPDQLTGPDWLDDPLTIVKEGGTFDIEAKLPEGATADQVPAMLQALLADRFKLTVRRESHQVDTYALVIGKGGPKFQKKEPAQGEAEGQAAVDSRYRSTQAPGSLVKFGASTMTSIPGGGARIEASTTQGLVDYLSATLPMPVVDKTGLKGDYDIKMEIHPLGPAPGAPLDLKQLEESMHDASLAGLEKLGLKLEQQKNPVGSIVVEHVEKTPTEN